MKVGGPLKTRQHRKCSYVDRTQVLAHFHASPIHRILRAKP